MDENNYSVYMHVFPNGKRYFGITSQDPDRRWRANGEGYCQPSQRRMRNAIMKYGWVNVTHIVLMTGVSLEDAVKLERQLIENNRAADPRFGYNHTKGGEGPLRWTQAMRDKLSAARKGKPGHLHTEATKKKIGDANKRRVFTPQMRANMSRPKRAYNATQEARDAIKARHTSQMRRVRQLTLDGAFIREFSSLRDAAEASGRPRGQSSKISEAANAVKRGRQKSAFGFLWEWSH